MKPRKQIAAGEKVPLELNERERDLITTHTFAGKNLTDRLRIMPCPGGRPYYRFTLDDLDELAGYVAAEANHAKVKKLEKELRRLYARIAEIPESYTDEPGRPPSEVATNPSVPVANVTDRIRLRSFPESSRLFLPEVSGWVVEQLHSTAMATTAAALLKCMCWFRVQDITHKS